MEVKVAGIIALVLILIAYIFQEDEPHYEIAEQLQNGTCAEPPGVGTLFIRAVGSMLFLSDLTVDPVESQPDSDGGFFSSVGSFISTAYYVIGGVVFAYVVFTIIKLSRGQKPTNPQKPTPKPAPPTSAPVVSVSPPQQDLSDSVSGLQGDDAFVRKVSARELKDSTLNQSVKLSGILVSLADSSSGIDSEVLEDLKKNIGQVIEMIEADRTTFDEIENDREILIAEVLRCREREAAFLVCEAELKQSKEDEKTSQETLDALEQELSQANAAVSASEQQYKLALAKLETLSSVNATNDELLQKIAQLQSNSSPNDELAAVNKEIEILQNQNLSLTSELTEANDQLLNLKGNISVLEENLSLTDADKVIATERVALLEAANEQLTDELRDAAAHINESDEASQKVRELQKEMSDTLTANKDLEAKLHDLSSTEKQLSDSAETIKELEIKLSQASQESSKFASKNETLHQDLQTSLQKVKSLEDQIQSGATSQSNEAAALTETINSLQDQLKEAQGDAESYLKNLKVSESDRDALNQKISSLESQAELSDKTESGQVAALKKESEDLRLAVTTLESQLSEKRTALAAEENKTRELASNFSDLEKTSATKIADLTSQNGQLSEAAKQFEQEISTLTAANSNLEAKVTSLSISSDALANGTKALTEANGVLEEKITALEKQQQDQPDTVTIQQQLISVTAEKASLEKEFADALDRIEELQEKAAVVEKNQPDVDDPQHKLTTATAEKAAIEKDFSELQAKVTVLEENQQDQPFTKDVQKQLASLTAEKASLEKEFTDALDRIEELQEKAAASEKDDQVAKQANIALTRDYAASLSKIKQLESDESALITTVASLEKQVVELQTSKDGISNDMNDIIKNAGQLEQSLENSQRLLESSEMRESDLATKLHESELKTAEAIAKLSEQVHALEIDAQNHTKRESELSAECEKLREDLLRMTKLAEEAAERMTKDPSGKVLKSELEDDRKEFVRMSHLLSKAESRIADLERAARINDSELMRLREVEAAFSTMKPGQNTPPVEPDRSSHLATKLEHAGKEQDRLRQELWGREAELAKRAHDVSELATTKDELQSALKAAASQLENEKSRSRGVNSELKKLTTRLNILQQNNPSRATRVRSPVPGIRSDDRSVF
eukprot:TRINITY_DN16758_c1_g1_i1.p1 TRINITY_DN16758_c1_g1~~TRINITY_DN16758_c1_g1_i1.p1  ORF type:complete len:1144 (+),score=327.04 TRINITY_DN16758_c1_g1_i1:62-3493(+)